MLQVRELGGEVGGVDDAVTAVRHILSGRGFDEAASRIEKLRLQTEEDPSERAVDRFTRAEEQFNVERTSSMTHP